MEALPSRAGGLVVHSGRGAAIRPKPDASYPIRKRHFLASTAEVVVEGAEDSWVDNVMDVIDSGGFALQENYGNLSTPEDIDDLATYGEQSMERLKGIKKRYDEGNLFSLGYPRLA